MTNFDKELFSEWGKAFAAALAFILLALACMMCGCRTQYVPVETVRTEYIRTDSMMFEKVLDFMRESVRRSQSSSDTTIFRITNTYTLDANGDTIKSDTNTQEYHSTNKEVELERIITQLRDSNRMLEKRLDSQKVDSIQVPYPVEKQLSKWEQTKMSIGGLTVGVVIAFVIGAVIVWLIKKFRK